MNDYGKGAAARSRTGRMIAAAGLALALVAGGALEAYAQNCKPRQSRPPITITNMGLCEFDPEMLSFAGTPAEQAMCLMRAADRSRHRNIGPPLESLPAGITSRAGQTSGLPEREPLAALLVELGLVWDYAPFLWMPLSRASDNVPDAPQARYFVIHDTSAPFLGWQPFPADIDQNPSINNLARYDCKDDWALAHVFINRSGQMLLSRELGQPWRSTKFERAAVFDNALKGLFLHIELIQPRGTLPSLGGRNDARAPDPGFSAAQYDRLALVYVIASVRSGRWLIPAFHAAIDSGVRGGHDDPQNFEIPSFAASIDKLVGRLMHGNAVVASVTETETKAPVTEPPAAVDPAPVTFGSASSARAAMPRQSETLEKVTPAVASADTTAAITPAVAAIETPAAGEPSIQPAPAAPRQQAWQQNGWKQATWTQQQRWKQQSWKRQTWKRPTWQQKTYRSRYVSSKPKGRYRR
jgi:hypothetical protein